MNITNNFVLQYSWCIISMKVNWGYGSKVWANVSKMPEQHKHLSNWFSFPTKCVERILDCLFLV